MTKANLDVLTEQYACALENYLAGGGEAGLRDAYELARQALANGLGVLEMASLHHEALAKILPRLSTPEERARMAKATEKFFVESLTPFEMTHRGFREANAALRASETRYRELFENANDIVFGVLEQFAVSGLAGPKRGVGLAESAMRHFERRQALDKELFGGLGHSGPLLRSGQTREDFRQSLVMQRSHLQNPQAVREGLAGKFVGVPKTGFSAAGEIVFECACVLLR